MTAERSELQILGFRDLEITNFRSLDIRAMCLICVNLSMLAMHSCLMIFLFRTKATSVDKFQKVDYQNYIQISLGKIRQISPKKILVDYYL